MEICVPGSPVTSGREEEGEFSDLDVSFVSDCSIYIPTLCGSLEVPIPGSVLEAVEDFCSVHQDVTRQSLSCDIRCQALPRFSACNIEKMRQGLATRLT